jgi:hypothetical protein
VFQVSQDATFHVFIFLILVFGKVVPPFERFFRVKKKNIYIFQLVNTVSQLQTASILHFPGCGKALSVFD